MTSAAIFDLDRTVLRSSSSPVIQRHLVDAGLTTTGFPIESIFQTTYELFGESGLIMRVAKRQSGAKAGWKIDEVATIAEKIADELMDMVMPFVPSIMADHKAAGRTLVLATGSNKPTIQALADRLGFDVVIATDWEVDGDTYTGAIAGERLLGSGKSRAVQTWAQAESVDLKKSWFYTDSRFDADLLAEVGHPVCVNPDFQLAVLARLRRWPVRHLDKPEGVAKILGRELQDWARPLSRPELDPFATFTFEGIENIPSEGGAILVFNHRSYLDASVMSYVLAKGGRAGRFLGKKEVFDVPVAGTVAKALGGIRVDRGTGSDEPLEKAIDALRGGDVVSMAPQGTIPRGPAFFDPELKGRWGAFKLATAAGVPIVPVGIWGTEKVFPRNARLPKIPVPGSTKPTIAVSVGKPFTITTDDPDKGTAEIMAKIVAQLPPEARKKRKPTTEELAATFPPGYTGDPTAETDRRPGTDT